MKSKAPSTMSRAGTNQRVVRNASHRQFGSLRVLFMACDHSSVRGEDGYWVRMVRRIFAELRSRMHREGPRCPGASSSAWGFEAAQIIARHGGAPCRRPVFPAHHFVAMNNSPLPYRVPGSIARIQTSVACSRYVTAPVVGL